MDTTPTSILNIPQAGTTGPATPFNISTNITSPAVTPPTQSAPVSTPISQPTQQSAPVQTQQGSNQPVTQTPAVSASGSTQSNPFALSQVMGAIQNQITNNNQLVNAKNLVLKQLYDVPLSDSDKAQLQQNSPGLAAALQSGDRNLIDFNLRLLNDQIAGRTDTLDQSISTLSSGYNTAVQQAETNRQDALNTVLSYAKANGQKPSAILNALYPQLGAQLGAQLDSIAAPYGAYIPPTAGSTGISSLGSLLGYYTQGNISSIPGSGYTNAILQQLQGTGLDLNSPPSALTPYIPQIAQGITNGENISPELLAATNNPGAIEQATAEQYGLPTSSNGYYDSGNGITYAQFPDQDTGTQALQSLVGDYLQTASAPVDASVPSGPTANVQDSTTGLSPNGLYAAALQYAANGTMPSLGLGSATQTKAARQAIINKAGAILAQNGGSIAGNKAEISSNAAALKQQSEYLNTIQRSVSTVDDNIKILQEAAGNVNDSSAPIVNQVTNDIKLSTGDGALNAFKAAIQTVRTEYANILARGGQVTDQNRTESANLIPDNISLDQLNQVIGVLQSESTNVVGAAQQQVQKIQSNINQIVQPGASGSSGASSGQTQTTPSGFSYTITP